jgi:hypothetical protein
LSHGFLHNKASCKVRNNLLRAYFDKSLKSIAQNDPISQYLIKSKNCKT